MTISSFPLNMFNRLPLYTRPKEPAIGVPVLTKSTNERLSGKPVGDSLDTLSKGLPQIPTSSLMDESFPPPRYNRTDPLPQSSSSSNVPAREDSSSQAQLFPHTLRSSTVPKPNKFSVNRKPAPQPAPAAPLASGPIWDGTGGSYTTFITTGGQSQNAGESQRSGGSGFLRLKKSGDLDTAVKESSSRSGGFTFSGLVGRRKISPPPEEPNPVLTLPDPGSGIETPVITRRPPNLVSIDEWLDSREPLHKRSNTMTTVSTQYTQYNSISPTKLHLRQSTFAPLRPPEELISEEGLESQPELPSIPPQFLPRTSSKFPPAAPTFDLDDASPPTPQAPIQRPMSPPKTPPPPPPPHSESPEQSEQPADRVTRLEREQAILEDRKMQLRMDIYRLDQLLPPNPSTHNPQQREQMRVTRDNLVQEVASVEKDLHEVGMKLHRAYRRRDRQDGTEGPTHLWISRVCAVEN